MRIQHNISAMNAYRNYNNNAGALGKNLEKLSSGYRINRAGDDAAGLAISEKMRAQITGLDAAGKNVKDGISLVKTAEGAMQEVHDMLGRMKYLATQSANGTYQDAVDRENIQKEVNSLLEEIDRIADSANFNGQKLLNGELDSNPTMQAFSGMPTVGSVLGTNTRLAADKTEPTSGTKFSVDLGNLKITGNSDSNAGSGASFGMKIGDIGITLSNTTNQTWNDRDASGIASALANAFNAVTGANGTTTLSSSNWNVTITGLKYYTSNSGMSSGLYTGASQAKGGQIKVSASGNKLVFEQVNIPKASDDEMIGERDVTFDSGTLMGFNSNMTYNQKTVEVTTAKAGHDKILASTRISLNKDMMKVGNTLKFGKTTVTMVKGTAQAGEVQVDDLLEGMKNGTMKEEDALKTFADRVSVAGSTSNEWSVSTVNGTTTGEIDIIEKIDLDSEVHNQFKTLNGIKDSLGLGVAGTALNLQIGDTSEAFNKMDVNVKDMHAKSLGINGLDVSTANAANEAINKIMGAINTVSSTRGDLGAIQNRLEHTSNNLSVMKENIQDAESTIRDTDVAEEMMKYTKNNILLQSAQAMLAQANQMPQGVLQLLQ